MGIVQPGGWRRRVLLVLLGVVEREGWGVGAGIFGFLSRLGRGGVLG